jgi:hypothetical protein
MTNYAGRPFTTNLPDEIIGRVKIESARTRRRIGEVVADALDRAIPPCDPVGESRPRHARKLASPKS